MQPSAKVDHGARQSATGRGDLPGSSGRVRHIGAMPLRTVPRPRAYAAALAALALVVTGCSGGGDDPAKRPTSQPIEGGATLAAVWPLTGEPVKTATPDHPVLVVKIDNSAASQPQVGLSKADLVTEELVEGGYTRLAAMFYQRLPTQVGPVRSMRATDIGVVKPAHGVIIASGGAPNTLARMVDADVPVRVEGQGPGWTRDGSRVAPYNLMIDLAAAGAALGDLARVPASYLPWGKGEELAAGQPAGRFDAVFSRTHTTSWRYDQGSYVNENSFAAEGDRFRPDTVLVLRVQQGDAGYLDPAGNTVPESLYTGRGKATVFHGGKMLEATWSKKSRRQPLRLRTADGALTLPAGRTWIELLPRDVDGGSLQVG